MSKLQAFVQNYGKSILLRVLFFASILVVIGCIWKLSVSEATRPIEQQTEEGWFQGMGSEIREIRMSIDPKVLSDVTPREQFTVNILDEEGNVVWEKVYSDVTFEPREYLLLEQYERGAGIAIGEGNYRIVSDYIVDDTEEEAFRIYTYSGNYQWFYKVCAIISFLFLGAILVITFKRQEKYSLPIWYFTALVLMGILFSMVMPPLTVPDEESHFAQAYNLSSKMMMQEKYDYYGNRMMRETDLKSITYLHSAASIGRWYATFDETTDVNKMVSYTQVVSVSSTTPDYAYLFPAIGITIARVCKMNGHWLLLLGRIFNLIGVSAILSFALYLIPFGKKYLCVLGLLPEIVYLCASYSYDALNYALCFLAISYFFYMLLSDKQIGLRNLMILLLIIVLMLPIKMVYASFLGLFLLIPRKRLSLNNRWLTGALIVTIVGVCGLLVWRWPDIAALLEPSVIQEGEEVRCSFTYMIHNPGNVIFTFVNNIMVNFDDYLRGFMGEFVGRDRYGVLLDIANLPVWMMMSFAVLLVQGIRNDRRAMLHTWQKVWVGVMGLSSIGLIFLSMYLANNLTTDITIHGVQGRYFLPIALLVPLLFAKNSKSTTNTIGANDVSNESMAVQKTGVEWYIIAAAGLDILAIFVQLQHLAIDYYG